MIRLLRVSRSLSVASSTSICKQHSRLLHKHNAIGRQWSESQEKNSPTNHPFQHPNQHPNQQPNSATAKTAVNHEIEQEFADEEEEDALALKMMKKFRNVSSRSNEHHDEAKINDNDQKYSMEDRKRLRKTKSSGKNFQPPHPKDAKSMNRSKLESLVKHESSLRSRRSRQPQSATRAHARSSSVDPSTQAETRAHARSSSVDSSTQAETRAHARSSSVDPSTQAETRAKASQLLEGAKSRQPKSAPKPTHNSSVSSSRLLAIDRNGQKQVFITEPVTKEVETIGNLDSEKIPRLAHKLDRALFSPGVHFLQDPRTRIYNFTPYLKNIIKLEDFNFDLVEKFVTVSKDEVLLKAAVQQGKNFYSSTSSMTSTLTQFYLFLNNYDPKSTTRFAFPPFTQTVQKLPSSVLVRPKGKNEATGETVYAIESDKSADQEILLSAMGHCLEALLTNEQDEFAKYNVNFKYGGGDAGSESREAQLIETKMKQTENTYNYATYGQFLMRSQLDCYDDRLPGKGTFDLKSRAVCAIRYDQGHPELANNTYQIWKLEGKYESFQREFEDLIRTGALLKYGFQARIGQMDGIFVAYHNINSFFGFQYLPLSDIDRILYSCEREPRMKDIKSVADLNEDLPTHVAETQFKVSLEMWQELLEKVKQDLKNKGLADTTFRLVMKSDPIHKTINDTELMLPRLYAMAVPLTEEKASELQEFSNKFKTSFREDISVEEREANLRKHKVELDEFNKTTVDQSPIGVLNYVIKCDTIFDDDTRTHKHPLPTSTKQDWKFKYTIFQGERDPQPYLKLLQRSTQMLVVKPGKVTPNPKGKSETSAKSTTTEHEQPQDKEEEVEQDSQIKLQPLDIDAADQRNDMRVISAVGKARAKVWQEKDNKPVMYVPR